MIHEELYLSLNYNQKVIFAIAIVMIVLIVSIIARMKNKTKKLNRRQITHKKVRHTFTIDCEEFVKVNFKKQDYLFENQNRVSELIRLLNY